MERQKWNVVPRDNKVKLTGDLLTRAKNIELFFMRPDKELFWGEWLRMVLEDLIVLDAPSIYRRRTRGGDLYALEVIDGATIKRVIDDWGRTPPPPMPAYQQVLKGYPAINYTADDLIYAPRNRRPGKIYGYSPVEQIIMTVNIALRRQIFQLSYYTEGNVPESLIGVPEAWTPDQIRSFQDWFDSVLQGDLAARRRARFVPGGVAKGYTPTKTDNIFGDGDEWLARVCCFAMGMSPQPFVKMMNRATAGTAQEQAEEEGLVPIMQTVKRLMDRVIIDDFKDMDLEFQWVRENELDETAASAIARAEAEDGIITINEARQRRGEDPYPDPVFDRPMVKTLSGWTAIDPKDQIDDKQQMMEAFPPPPPPPVAETGAEPQGGNGPPSGGGSAEPKPKPPSGAGGGKGGGGGATEAASKATPPHVHGQTLTKKDPVPVDRPLVRRAQKRYAKAVAAILRDVGDDVAGQVEKALKGKRKVTKADDDGSDPAPILTAAEIQALVDGLDLDGLNALQDVSADELGVVAGDASVKALAQIGVNPESDLVDVVNDRALAWATSRAAELVGKRVLADGSVIDNPSKAWAIDPATRDMIRSTIETVLKDNLGSEALVDALQDPKTFAFSADRADMISRTEIARANSVGALESYKSARDAGVTVLKSWEVDDEPCPICEANGDQDPIPLDDDFESGDSEPPAHPNCECALSPVVDESEISDLNAAGDGSDEEQTDEEA